MQAVRYSRQREAIKNYLLSTTSHPTAEMVYNNIRKELPNISLGTVYRNLNFLADNNEVLRLNCGDGYVHFDGCTYPHNHFFCRQCRSLSDIEMDSIEHIDKIANAGFNGVIEGHTVIFYGMCHNCLKTQ
jgi:Fe2+/Zn2+ uptake regulation proteins